MPDSSDSPDSVFTALGSTFTTSPPSPATSASHHEDELPTVSALEDIFSSSPSDDIAELGRGSSVHMVSAETYDDPITPTVTATATATAATAASTREVPQTSGAAVHASEPSDLPSLRRQHVTNGYRAGIILAKQKHLQRGFDEGYPFGAKLGLRAGVIKGVLEGLIKSDIDDASLKKIAGEMRQRAELELEVSKVFSKAANAVAPGAGANEEMGAGSAGQSSDSEAQRQPPHVVLDKIGDQVISEWEDTVNELLAQIKFATTEKKQKQKQKSAEARSTLAF
ncbi:Essential protein Yae1, N terminal [Ascosphaera aggregata]|nr:Essential protein Yae1, N terminal [Ascosphaera aggregata]